MHHRIEHHQCAPDRSEDRTHLAVVHPSRWVENRLRYRDRDRSRVRDDRVRDRVRDDRVRIPDCVRRGRTQAEELGRVQGQRTTDADDGRVAGETFPSCSNQFRWSMRLVRSVAPSDESLDEAVDRSAGKNVAAAREAGRSAGRGLGTFIERAASGYSWFG